MDKLLLTEAYPIVAKNFSKPETQKAYKALVKEFMNKNNEAMTAIAPVKQIYFARRDELFKLAGLDQKQLSDIMQRSKDIKSDAMIVNPFTLLMSLITRYCIMERKADLLKITNIVFAFSFYTRIYRRYFKYDPNPNIMAYAVNNMSGKYKLKQSGLFNTMYDVSDQCLTLHTPKLKIGTDKSHVAYILDLRTRLNAIMKNIFRAFKDAHDNGHIMYTQSDNFEEEGFRETENTNIVGDRVAKAASLKITTSGVDYRLVTYAAKITQVSVNDMRNYMSNIIANSDEIHTLVESIVFAYLAEGFGTDSIHSTNFLINCLQIYKRSNSTDPNITNMKACLDNMIKRYTNVLSKTSRQATVNNFRRALYIYFVLVIQSVG